MSKKMILVDTSKCTGCKACSAACKEWNELPAVKTTLVKSYQSTKDLDPNTYTYVAFDEKYENNKMLWMMRKAQCFHCADAACLKACTSEAISKTETGFTIIDKDKCIGCGYCVTNCPFDIPRVDQSTKKATKCTGCWERVENGLEPACVAICQPGTLTVGDDSEMMPKAEQRLAELKTNYPKANLYGKDVVGGTLYKYILLDTPESYGLPANPTVPFTLTLWKDIARPLGAIACGGAAAAVLVGTLVNVAKGNYSKEHFVDDDHQGKGGAV
ncbi:Fe-S-cluster-containing hydrogenase subunit [Desulfitobacterium dichloroeliminans LMG P-21439]|uniref:Fe-S-cluster-containing hydrogenase subunit n=1 Tax=Desulfitobacterium dichloroeliminans (strain LMG P-21439 / DCA1) TaxID=871963 RepID=L0F977_DESDL|nr:4Fe-4S dicluster domain-containing protein [Desulfitobacterium dichloroeliminans]AGA70389.1 Fe-S-cluster-containing hydrogenase subunit [Desulfitobacterium dichloroeliminans LMG P-21439]